MIVSFAGGPNYTYSQQRGTSEQWFEVKTGAELGYLAPLSHKIQYGQNGTYFDYVNDGGQDVLYPFTRLSAEASFNQRHSVIFMLQPLTLQSQVILGKDTIIDDEVFPADTPMSLTYGFSFPRISYIYDFVRSPKAEVSAGLSLQLRSANIVFASQNGELMRTSRDIGPVPILKFRFRRDSSNGWFYGTEIDGFYAPGAIINARDVDVLGAIWDASARAGLQISPDIEAFLNVRYVGGGADGTTDDPNLRGDGYVKNWLHLMTVSLGFNYSL